MITGEQMDIRKIRKLIELIHKTGVREIEVKSGKDSVRISRQVDALTPTRVIPETRHSVTPPTPSIEKTQVGETEKTAENSNEPAGHILHSPMVGTVYLMPNPNDKPFVAIGQSVKIGDTLCLIEAMKMFNKIEADKPGIIRACLIKNEQPVEYDQPLFIIDTNE